MSTHNIGFDEDLTKIIFQLSSNTHLISSSVAFAVITLIFKHQGQTVHGNVSKKMQLQWQTVDPDQTVPPGVV